MNNQLLVRGFTLIEVLIAATILFAVITTVSQVYKGAITASIRASRAVDAAAVVPLLADTITFHIRQAGPDAPIAQQGVIHDYMFSWQANVIKRSPAAPRFEFETDRYVTGDERFYLWQVQLELTKERYAAQYEFTVLSWKGL